MNKKCLIIGSNSFSGSSFVNFLLKNKFQVFGVSRSKQLNSVFLPYINCKNFKNFKFFQFDLNVDLNEITKLIIDNEIPYVVNFAAQSMVAESWKNPEHWFNTNVVSTINLHNKLRNLRFLKMYVHFSTPEVYGNCQGVVDENQVFNPSTPYAVSRASSDMSLKTFGDAYNFPFVITRASNVYGPHQQLYRIIPRTILYLITGKKLKLDGGGLSNRSFIHIDDVSDALYKIMIKGKLKNSYHISTDEYISIKSLVELICNKMEYRFEEHVDIIEERLGKDTNYFLNSDKLKNDLKWKPLIDLNKGIEKCIIWVSNNLEVLKKEPHIYKHKI